MDNKLRCIYCNRSEDDGIIINASDIIPNKLTNKKIRNKNVCSKDHNQVFSSEFEESIIKNNLIKRIRNHLKIIDRNGIPCYEAELEIQGFPIKTKITSISKIKEKDIIISVSGSNKYAFGEIDKLQEKFNTPLDKIVTLNMAEIEIGEKIEIDLSIFFSKEMKRLVAKIAYEWICKIHKISCKHKRFQNIINYITNQQPFSEVVSVVGNVSAYKDLIEYTAIGTHSLLSYYETDNYLYVIFFFFGLVMYKVKINWHPFLLPSSWKKLNFFNVLYDGDDSLNLEICVNTRRAFVSGDAKKIIAENGEFIVENVIKLLQTRIISLRSVNPYAKVIEKILYECSKEQIFEKFIGTKDYDILYGFFLFTSLCNSGYDFNKTFRDNIFFIFDGRDEIIENNDKLYWSIKTLYDEGQLISKTKEGVRLFNQIYDKEIINK